MTIKYKLGFKCIPKDSSLKFSDFSYKIEVFFTNDLGKPHLQFSGDVNKNWIAGGDQELTAGSNTWVRVWMYFKKAEKKLYVNSALLKLSDFNKMPTISVFQPMFKAETKKDTGKTNQEERKKTKKCGHVDGAVLVAEYIVKEIQVNSKSSWARQIKISMSAYRNLEEYNKNPHPAEGKVSNPNKLIAMAGWTERVFAGRPWDHKPRIRDHKGLNKVAVIRALPGKPVDQLSYRYWHKYKNNDYFYDVWSNIHYGFVGLAVGFSEADLLSGASSAQVIDSKGGNSEDPIDDITSIKIGFALYKKFGPYGDDLTTQHVLNALENEPSKHYTESREIHWCYSEKNPEKISK